MQEIWVVEYSPEQNSIHIETLDRAMDANRRNIINGVSTGYIPVFAANDHRECSDFARAFLRRAKNNAQETF